MTATINETESTTTKTTATTLATVTTTATTTERVSDHAGGRAMGGCATAVDHCQVVVVWSSRLYPHLATTHHETTQWFAERYNAATTQQVVPNKGGV